MKKLNGDTCIGEALDYFYENMFTAEAGLRSDTKQRVIVMTDGHKNCRGNITIAARVSAYFRPSILRQTLLLRKFQFAKFLRHF